MEWYGRDSKIFKSFSQRTQTAPNHAAAEDECEREEMKLFENNWRNVLLSFSFFNDCPVSLKDSSFWWRTELHSKTAAYRPITFNLRSAWVNRQNVPSMNCVWQSKLAIGEHTHQIDIFRTEFNRHYLSFRRWSDAKPLWQRKRERDIERRSDEADEEKKIERNF